MACILIVDDHQVNRLISARVLTGGGHRVVESPSGQDALRKLEAGGIDLVVLDIDMPVMNGLEVLERIRATPALRTLPVLAHTAVATSSDELYFRMKGFDGLACKPVEPHELLALCDRLLAGRAAA